jgi:hypothetical protein
MHRNFSQNFSLSKVSSVSSLFNCDSRSSHLRLWSNFSNSRTIVNNYLGLSTECNWLDVPEIVQWSKGWFSKFGNNLIFTYPNSWEQIYINCQRQISFDFDINRISWEYVDWWGMLAFSSALAVALTMPEILQRSRFLFYSLKLVLFESLRWINTVLCQGDPPYTENRNIPCPPSNKTIYIYFF